MSCRSVCFLMCEFPALPHSAPKIAELLQILPKMNRRPPQSSKTLKMSFLIFLTSKEHGFSTHKRHSEVRTSTQKSLPIIRNTSKIYLRQMGGEKDVFGMRWVVWSNEIVKAGCNKGRSIDHLSINPIPTATSNVISWSACSFQHKKISGREKNQMELQVFITWDISLR